MVTERPATKALGVPKPGPNSKKTPAFYLTLRWNLPIRETRISHVTNLIGQFQRTVKFNAGILFVGSSAGLDNLFH